MRVHVDLGLPLDVWYRLAAKLGGSVFRPSYFSSA
jgi:hypothetical protein